MNEIQKVGAPLARVSGPNTTKILETIQEAVKAGIDPKELYAIFREETARYAVMSFNSSLADFQQRCPRIVKTKKTVGGAGFAFHYASLCNVLDSITDLLNECGFSRSWGMKEVGNTKYVVCFLKHRDGHVDESAMLPYTPDGGSMNAIQKIGSGASYLERYTLIMALGIATADMDDDGNGHVRNQSTITDDQCNTLNDLLIQTESNVKKFFEWCGFDKLSDIPASRYEAAVRILQEKLNKRKVPQ